eukprot:scaffold31458_cov67-Isochrysis_galbana.AAC.1
MRRDVRTVSGGDVRPSRLSDVSVAPSPIRQTSAAQKLRRTLPFRLDPVTASTRYKSRVVSRVVLR